MDDGDAGDLRFLPFSVRISSQPQSTLPPNIKYVQGNSFIDTNLIHNFLYKLHKINFLYMFRASSAYLQEVNDVNCTCMQPLVFSFSAGGRLVHLLREDCSLPLASAQDKSTRRPPAENENTRGCIHVQLT